jgi:hypothetical protein
MGTPQDPLAEQYARLEAGGLELLEPPRWVSAIGSKIDLVWSKYSNLLKPRVMALPLPTAFRRRYAPILDLVTLCYVRFGSLL